MSRLLARELDRLVAGRVRLDPGSIEHHRARPHRLADRLASGALLVELRDHVDERRGLQRVEPRRPDQQHQLLDMDPVLIRR